jgi:hypothetical protein
MTQFHRGMCGVSHKRAICAKPEEDAKNPSALKQRCQAGIQANSLKIKQIAPAD